MHLKCCGYAPTETPVTTSQADPFKSSNIRRLSAFEIGFSRISGRSGGRRDGSRSDVAGRVCVKTTVSAINVGCKEDNEDG